MLVKVVMQPSQENGTQTFIQNCTLKKYRKYLSFTAVGIFSGYCLFQAYEWKSLKLGFPVREECNSQVFKILRAANLPVRMDMGTPAGLYVHCPA